MPISGVKRQRQGLLPALRGSESTGEDGGEVEQDPEPGVVLVKKLARRASTNPEGRDGLFEEMDAVRVDGGTLDHAEATLEACGMGESTGTLVEPERHGSSICSAAHDHALGEMMLEALDGGAWLNYSYVT